MSGEERSRLAGMQLGFIGAGNMGGALMRGLLAAGLASPENLIFYDPDPKRQAEMARLGIETALDNPEVMHAPVVVLAVKPQFLEAALAEIRDHVRDWHLIISVVAGVTTAALEAALLPARVIRAMPNTPILVAAGITALAPAKAASPEDLALALEIFGAVGRAVAVEEKLMDAVTGLSGSGPAYAALFIEALTDGGVMMGLPRPLAHTLAVQTVLGAAKLILEEELHPGFLKDQVTSPGGTTIAGLHALEQGAFRGTVMNAVAAATRRARELGGK